LYYVQDIIGYQTVSLILLLILFLLPVFNFEKGPIILSAVISALAWDYYFIPPHFTMHIDKTEDVVMLFMFFFVAVTNGVLTSRLKVQKNDMIEKEKKLNALYNLIKDLSQGKNLDEIFIRVVKQIKNTFESETVIFLSENENKVRREPHPASNFTPDEMEWLAAETSFKNKTETGKNTGSVEGTEARYFPLIANGTVLSVIGIKINEEIASGKKEMEFLRNYIKEIIPFIEKYISYSMP
jgi:two-component system sensor histidine kinase KdpD